VGRALAQEREAEAWIPAGARAALDALGPRDVVVGVHALNQSRSVKAVVDAWDAGLRGLAVARKAVILLVDAGSADNTVEAATADREAGEPVPLLPVALPAPVPRGRAILATLGAAAHLGARAWAVVDAGLASASREWAPRLLGPVLDGSVDCVLPAYDRAVTEGTLTTNLLAPLTRILTGRRVDEVLGGCGAFSASLADHLLGLDDLADDLSGPGTEMRLVVEALLVCDAVAVTPLGLKHLDPGVAPPDVSRTVVDVVGALFRLFERHVDTWPEGRRAAPVRRLGTTAAAPASPAEVSIERMVRAFRLGLKDLLPVWEQIMPEDTLGQLYTLGLLAADEFRFPPPLWTRVVADFLIGHHERRLPRDHLLRALTPLYLGRVAAFVRETQAGPASRIPGILEAVDRAFEAERASLAARWR
jgi:glycosyltransferase involved in cell wall biosynthesis